MCGICFNKYDNIYISDYEIKKNGISYTYDTLIEIKKTYKNDRIYFLVGSDMLLYLEKWYRFQDLLTLCVFVAAFRTNRDNRDNRDNNSKEMREVLEFREKLVKMGAEIELLENEPFEISSTELRGYIKNNNRDSAGSEKYLEKYINAGVLSYIKENNIY
jgi:nicotinate-nucleotide adenylyltransferase